jgi:hypothetical protein
VAPGRISRKDNYKKERPQVAYFKKDSQLIQAKMEEEGSLKYD